MTEDELIAQHRAKITALATQRDQLNAQMSEHRERIHELTVRKYTTGCGEFKIDDILLHYNQLVKVVAYEWGDNRVYPKVVFRSKRKTYDGKSTTISVWEKVKHPEDYR